VTERIGGLLKTTGEAGESIYGGGGTWPLPDGDRPGEWVTGRSDLYFMDPAWLLTWMGPLLWEAEADGSVEDPDAATGELVTRRARLVRRVDGWTADNLVAFAADAAEHVAHLWRPDSPTPLEAIEAARSGDRQRAADAARALASAKALAAACAAADAARAGGLTRTVLAVRHASILACEAAELGKNPGPYAALKHAILASESAARAGRAVGGPLSAFRNEHDWQTRRLRERVGV
jgi:hypothetical protein